MIYTILKYIFKVIYSIFFRARVEGIENIPVEGPVIIAANHMSNWDPMLLGTYICRNIHYMAKEELFKNKLFAWLIRSLGAFPVARGKGDTTVIDTSVERLDNGKNLMIFPEGTRSKDGKVGRGHTGAALISARSGKPIIPVGICYGDKLRFRTKITVKFGKPIDPAEYCEICDSPNPRQLVKLKNRYMADIKLLVEGEPEGTENVKEDESNE